ncbi:helix-turn-helix transcriptional regulator [Listeria weihenstephanensis]|uniref:Helix-turn-helix transcriptional regulator n=1 Tax=Listeria weihenstephanensis TaxID=1006155 RepID=A0A841Z8T1_9LIST|nr:TetR family transcriptional regulator [Listeria weihenstephanensis]MBC1501259.1 helix-turn-helix transcriptional regulator [Listeria weihenstephanensis]
MSARLQVSQPLNIDLRVQKTQTKLYGVLAGFFHDGRAFESITVQDLCAEAGVSRATFYRHHEWISQIIEVQILRKLREFSVRFDQEKLLRENVVRLVVEMVQNNRELFQIIEWSRMESGFVEIISGEFLRIGLLLGAEFTHEQFARNYLARMILELGLEVGLADTQFENGQLVGLVLESVGVVARG